MSSDSAKHMEHTRQSLRTEDDNLIVYGCAAHWLNLFGEDITPSAILKHVTEVHN